MKRMKRWLGLGLVVVLLLAGCAAREVQQPAANTGAPADEQRSFAEGGAYTGKSEASGTGELERMVIRNASLDLIVKDTLQTQTQIGKLVDEWGGYILSAESYNYGAGQVTINLTLRVPAEKFNEALAQLRALATEVRHESVSSQDVTQEYVDLESRLRALEAKARQLEQFMKEAQDTDAVLKVYEQLSATLAEIEQVKGRMQYLENSVALATIELSLTPDVLAQPVVLPGWHPSETVKGAFKALVSTYQFLLDALIWIVIYAVPVLGAIGLVVYGVIRLLRRIFRRKPRPAVPPTVPPAA